MRLLLLSILLVITTTLASAQVLNEKGSSGFSNDQQQELAEPTIKIFPVPVTGNRFTITSDLPFKFVRMTNIIGQEICRDRVDYPVTRRVIEFDGAEKGIYLVSIELTDGRKCVRKILIEPGR